MAFTRRFVIQQICIRGDAAQLVLAPLPMLCIGAPAVAQSSQFGPFSAPSECPLFPKAAIQMSLRACWHPIPIVQPQSVGPVAFGSKRKAFHRPITRKRPC